MGALEHISNIIPRMLSEEPVAKCEEWPEPPYDSPIERIFASCCFKHLRPDVQVEKQVEVSTGHGRFRIDFVLSVGDRRIAVECDGKDFHESFRDEFRDAILLGEGHFETVYHFRGCDITYWTDDCIWLMSVLDPQLFSERGHHQLGRLHHSEVDRIRGEAEEFSYSIWDGREPFHFRAFRRSIKTASAFPHLRYHWKVLYALAGLHSGYSLDNLLENRFALWQRYWSKDEPKTP